MALVLVAYSYVEPGGPVPSLARHSVDPDLAAYLEQHVSALLGRVGSKTTPPAYFSNGVAANRFTVLRNGNTPAFLKTATELGVRLHREMDQRTKRGFLVALRRQTGQGPEAAVLKLDVLEKAGAAIQETAGQPDLAAVKDMLDAPGELQKGAVTPDPRPNSDVVIGEQFVDTSQYFLRALEISQSYSTTQSVREIVKVVSRVAPGSVPRLFEELERTAPVSVTDFFAQHPDILPTPDNTADVLGRLNQLKRPLQPIDPNQVPIRRTILADGIKITGRPQELAAKLQITPLPDNRWRITIDVDSEPRDEA
jgi:hypothetical protein